MNGHDRLDSICSEDYSQRGSRRWYVQRWTCCSVHQDLLCHEDEKNIVGVGKHKNEM